MTIWQDKWHIKYLLRIFVEILCVHQPRQCYILLASKIRRPLISGPTEPSYEAWYCCDHSEKIIHASNIYSKGLRILHILINLCTVTSSCIENLKAHLCGIRWWYSQREPGAANRWSAAQVHKYPTGRGLRTGRSSLSAPRSTHLVLLPPPMPQLLVLLNLHHPISHSTLLFLSSSNLHHPISLLPLPFAT